MSNYVVYSKQDYLQMFYQSIKKDYKKIKKFSLWIV